jgi:predicted transcriptional regulator
MTLRIRWTETVSATGQLARIELAVSDWYHVAMALTVRTDEKLEEALTALAESEGISRQEIIRRAVLDRYERAGHGQRVDRSSRKMIERWGDVLERLGSE